MHAWHYINALSLTWYLKTFFDINPVTISKSSTSQTFDQSISMFPHLATWSSQLVWAVGSNLLHSKLQNLSHCSVDLQEERYQLTRTCKNQRSVLADRSWPGNIVVEHAESDVSRRNASSSVSLSPESCPTKCAKNGEFSTKNCLFFCQIAMEGRWRERERASESLNTTVVFLWSVSQKLNPRGIGRKSKWLKDDSSGYCRRCSVQSTSWLSI